MLTAKFKMAYPTTNKNGVRMDMFVYYVHGTEQELEQFQEVQGDYYRTDDATGNALWHSSKFHGDNATLIIAQATDERPARVIADTSQIAKANSLMKQYAGTAIGAAIAQQIAASLLSQEPPVQQSSDKG